MVVGVTGTRKVEEDEGAPPTPPVVELIKAVAGTAQEAVGGNVAVIVEGTGPAWGAAGGATGGGARTTGSEAAFGAAADANCAA